MSKSNTDDQQVIIVYTTVDSTSLAESISKSLLNKKLIACSNLIANMSSFYMWKGKFEKAEEHVLLLKSLACHYEAIEKEIQKLHTYDCPCIMSWAIDKSSHQFMSWVKSQVSV